MREAKTKIERVYKKLTHVITIITNCFTFWIVHFCTLFNATKFC